MTVSLRNRVLRRAAAMAAGLLAMLAVPAVGQSPFEVDWLARCQEQAVCSARLRMGHGPIHSLRSSTDSLVELGLRTAVALSLLEVGGRGTAAMCLAAGSERDPAPLDSAIVTALQSPETTIVQFAECRVTGSGLNWHYETVAGGHAAFVVTATPLSISAGSAQISIAYGAAALMGAEWSCAVQRRDAVWIPNSCRLILLR